MDYRAARNIMMLVMPDSHLNAEWSNFPNAKLANCLQHLVTNCRRSSQMGIWWVRRLPKCVFRKLPNLPNAKMVATRPTVQMRIWVSQIRVRWVGRLTKCAFDYLKCAFEELVASRPTRDQLCSLKVGQLTKCTFGVSAYSPTAHLWRPKTVGQLRIWEVGQLRI